MMNPKAKGEKRKRQKHGVEKWRQEDAREANCKRQKAAMPATALKHPGWRRDCWQKGSISVLKTAAELAPSALTSEGDRDGGGIDGLYIKPVWTHALEH